MMRGTPARILLALAVVALGVALWRLWPRSPGPSPDDLASTALTAPTARQQAMAAAQLADYGAASVPALRRLLNDANQPDVQAVCIEGLAGQWDYQSMDRFLDLTESESPEVRGRAAQAVMRMTGRQRPYSSDASPEERRVLIRHMRGDWEEIKRASAEDREELFRRLRESHENKS